MLTAKKFSHDLSDKLFDYGNIKEQFYCLSQENKSTQKAIAHLRADIGHEINQVKKILDEGKFQQMTISRDTLLSDNDV